MENEWQEEWQDLVDKAIGHADLQDYDAAEGFLRRSLELATAGCDDERRAMSLNNLAGLLYERGRVGEAEPLLREVLTITERMRGPHDPFLAQAHANVAMVAEGQERYEDAEGHYRKALAILEDPRAREPSNVATTTAETLYNLADLYRTQGRAADARPLLERAVAVLRQAWGPFHMDVAATLDELGQVLVELEDFDAAIVTLRSLADVRSQLLGEGHVGVAHVLNDLGVLTFRQGDAAEAEDLYRKALAIREAELGADHPGVATCENNLGGLCLHLGRAEEAVGHFERALGIWEPTVGLGDPEVAMLLTNLGRANRQLERFDAAAAAYERSIESWTRILGADHPGLKKPAAELADALRAAGRTEDAEAVVAKHDLA